MSNKKKSGLETEIATRLELAEGHIEQMRTRWRALPADHRERPELLRRIEVSAGSLWRAPIVVVSQRH